MKTLSQLIKEFDGSGLTKDKLCEKFEEIAKAAIYGGYFRVNDEYDIFIVEVEFYFHSEDEKKSIIHDWAMYHRNNKGRTVEYFPVGSLHPHNSGVDVTFEKEGEYRASFLIRKYEIVEKGKSKVYSQPSYLREDLFGYAGCICRDKPKAVKIEWIEDNETSACEDYSIEKNPRINVGAYEENGERKEGLFDNREWRFTRKK